MKKILSLIICIVLLCGCSQTSSGLEKVTFVLDWTPNTNHTGLYVADALGYYEEAGIEIDIVQPPEDGANALVASGMADFGIGFQESIAVSLTADYPLPITAVAAVLQHNTSGIIAKEHITDFKSMEGSTYATWDTPIEKESIRYCMELQGGDFDKVNLIPSTVTDIVSALQTNIDCVWIYEAWDKVAAELGGLKYNFFKFSDVAPELDFYTPVIIAGDDYLKNNEETTRKFLSATKKGYEYAIAHPEEAAKILLEAAPALSEDLVVESQKVISAYYKDADTDWGYIDKDRWCAFYNWLYEENLINQNLGEKGFTNFYLE